MDNGTGSRGHALAAAGGAGLAASLWLPWYTIDIPQSTLSSLAQASQQWGALGGLIRSGTALLSQLGPFHVTAWQAFKTFPAVLLVVAIIGGGLALLALTDRAGNTSQLTMLAGGLAAVLVGYRLLEPPGSGGFVHPAWAIYLALVSALAMLAGGVMANQGRSEAPVVLTPLPSATAFPHVDPFATPAPAESWPAAGSLPPPAA